MARIGDMLVAAGFVSEPQVKEALAAQKTTGRRLGEELIALGFVSEVQMTQVLSNQLSIPWVSLHHVEFSRELLNLITGEMAERFGVIPIYQRVVRREGETLFIAMADPTNREALDAVAGVVDRPVKPMIAPPSDIRQAIRVYYFGKTAPSIRPTAARVEAEEVEAEIEIAELDEAQQAAVADVAERVEEGPRFITFALLDGTTVKLPAPGTSESQEQESELTASDLVSALVARSQGADVSDVLPDDRWEPLVATLLSLLVRKGLIADWEFVEAFKKNQGQ
ncbi:MAG: hypothetical protein AAGE52_28005 [Myxococcota bacterium]